MGFLVFTNFRKVLFNMQGFFLAVEPGKENIAIKRNITLLKRPLIPDPGAPSKKA
ncbi:MAG: hypothetical protein ABII06_07140 [Pseudomonadota bacterium]